MSDLPWVKVGWSVRVKWKDGGPDLVGQVSQVDDLAAKWFRLGSMDTSHAVSYEKVASIRILDSTTEITAERVDP